MMVPDSEVSVVRTSGTDESRMRCAKTANKDPTWIPSTSSASSLAVSVILSQKASVPQHQQEHVYAVLHRCHIDVMQMKCAMIMTQPWDFFTECPTCQRSSGGREQEEDDELQRAIRLDTSF